MPAPTPPIAGPPTLDPQKIIQTIRRLSRRIGERFPDSGLSKVAGQLQSIADDACARVQQFRRPNIGMRLLIGLVILAIVAMVVLIVTKLRFTDAAAWEVLEGTDAAISSIVFLGAALAFLISIENRLKRRRVLEAISELRVLAHIVDMHQLVKDPERFSRRYVATASSPRPEMTGYLLGRYLDYCSELLSLIGKVAVIYIEDNQDATVLTAIDELEDLTTGLSRKIWQKIMILDHLVEQEPQLREAIESERRKAEGIEVFPPGEAGSAPGEGTGPRVESSVTGGPGVHG